MAFHVFFFYWCKWKKLLIFLFNQVHDIKSVWTLFDPPVSSPWCEYMSPPGVCRLWLHSKTVTMKSRKSSSWKDHVHNHASIFKTTRYWLTLTFLPSSSYYEWWWSLKILHIPYYLNINVGSPVWSRIMRNREAWRGRERTRIGRIRTGGETTWTGCTSSTPGSNRTSSCGTESAWPGTSNRYAMLLSAFLSITSSRHARLFEKRWWKWATRGSSNSL